MIYLLAVWPTWLHWLESTFYPESGRWYALGSSWAGATVILTGSIAVYKQHNCKARWWCPLWGHHRVNGTTAIVCHAHHTVAHHKRLQGRHERKYAHRLAHGESPAKGIKEGVPTDMTPRRRT